ncbi:MAG: restriction endonuclease subunit S, partial [Finegoldia sp.]|uniref:restriction endonuclease subunit S n=1 Tax=Finegoldia sp. TaxID=1981334 RepID=UPI003992C1C5
MFKITRGNVLPVTMTAESQSDEKPYPVYSSQTKEQGLMGYYKEYLFEDAITWTTDGANAGTVNYRSGKFYCTNVCGVLLSDNNKANQMVSEALNRVSKSYVSYVGNPKLMNNVMADIEIKVPCSSIEQEKIGKYFEQLDHLITLHQCKESAFSEWKDSGFLQKHKTTWEQRKLGELGEILTGSTPSTTQTEYYSDDGIPWVTPTDINANLIYDTPKKLSEEGAEIGRVVPANTILCTCIASIGKNALLTVKGSFNQQINSLTPSKENDAYFLLTESELWSNTMKRMAASGTMQIVNKTEFSELQTMVPSLPEQQQIGEYFRNLDHLITLHQREVEKLQN